MSMDDKNNHTNTVIKKGLSIGILVHDEFEELLNLFKTLDNNIFKYNKINDKTLYEIIIVHDTSNISEDKKILVNKIFKLVNEYKNKWAVHIKNNNNKLIKYYTHDLNNNFAQQRNYLNDKCTKEYILQIDADELPSINLIYNYMDCFEGDDNYPLVAIPRINIVNGITNKFLRK